MEEASTKNAFALRKEGRLDEALAMARAIFEQTPQDPWAVKALGWCLYDAIKLANTEGHADEVQSLASEFSALEIDEYEDDVLWKCKKIAVDMADPTSGVRQKAKELSKQNHHTQAADLLRGALKKHPDHASLQESLGWELYRLMKANDDVNFGTRCLREYSTLKQIHSPGLLHSLMLRMGLQWAESWDKFLEFIEWWDLGNLRDEDFYSEWSQDGTKEYPALSDKVARGLYKHIKHYKKYDANLAWVVNYVSKVEAQTSNEWMPYYLAKLAAWLGGDLETIRKELIPLARTKVGEFWIWEALAEVSENVGERMACFAKAVLCKVQNESFKVGLYHIFSLFLIEQKEFAAASAAVRVYCQIQQKNNRAIAGDVQAFLQSELYDADESFDFAGFCKSNDSLADGILIEDIPWENGNFISVIKSDDGRPPLIRVYLENLKECRLKGASAAACSSARGMPIRVKISKAPSPSTLHHLHKIEIREGDDFDCLPDRQGVVSRRNEEKGLACVSLDYKDVVLLHFDKWPNAKQLVVGDCITLKAEHNSKNNRFYPLEWNKAPRTEIKGLFAKFSGDIDIQNGNKFGFIRTRGVDIFISPPQVRNLNLEDDDEVQGWAISGINKKKRNISWSALIVEKCLTSPDVME